MTASSQLEASRTSIPQKTARECTTLRMVALALTINSLSPTKSRAGGGVARSPACFTSGKVNQKVDPGLGQEDKGSGVARVGCVMLGSSAGHDSAQDGNNFS
ncbi:MAG TPA: hypothetical protein V6D26_27550, partial [Stenomitos sp.]